MNKITRFILVCLVTLTTLVFANSTIKAIDNSRQDLGILDSLKLTDQHGTVIDSNSNGAEMRVGYVYSLNYKWSLDEPSSDYRNKVATFDLPSVFDSTTVTPSSIPLYYDDAGTNVEIGTISINTATGTVTVQFNNSSILGDKSNIHGWISLSAECGSTLGTKDITVGWNGNNEDKISVKVIDPGVGENYSARLNKYVRSGMVGNQPIVQEDANGKFFVAFSVEVLISNSHSDLTLIDTVYSGMEVDGSSIKVISRPRDGSTYFLPTPNTYKDKYDLWQTQNPSGALSLNNNITAALQGSNSINNTGTGFEINFGATDFDSDLASRQLTTTPLQMRYRVDYNVFLTGVDPNATLAEAQTMFESQNAKNSVSLTDNKTIVTKADWNKGVLGGGAEGETRDVTLKKVDNDTSANLTGAVFNLYKQNAYNSSLWELYKSDITMTTSSILVNGLTFGTYRFEEITAPTGYVLPDTPFAAFTVDSTTPLVNFEITLKNTKIIEHGAIQFEKVDSLDPTLKLIASFEIHKKVDDSLVTTVTTDGTGKATINDLEVGDYYLVETSAPTDYQLDTTKHDFTITKDTTNTFYIGNNAIKNAKIINYGAIEFEKVDSLDPTLKLIATFEVHKKADDSLVTTVTTDGTGKATVSELEVGDYYLVETSAPTDYQLDTTKYDFTITKDSTNTIYLGNNAIKNTKIINYGAIQFEKTDSVNNSIKLKATFEVHKKADDSLVTTITTDNTGKALVNNLEVGDYYLVETAAPSGYILDSTHHNFTITKDTTNVIYVGDNSIKNTKEEVPVDKKPKGKSDLPDTGSNLSLILLIAIGGLGLLPYRSRLISKQD